MSQPRTWISQLMERAVWALPAASLVWLLRLVVELVVEWVSVSKQTRGPTERMWPRGASLSPLTHRCLLSTAGGLGGSDSTSRDRSPIFWFTWTKMSEEGRHEPWKLWCNAWKEKVGSEMHLLTPQDGRLIKDWWWWYSRWFCFQRNYFFICPGRVSVSCLIFTPGCYTEQPQTLVHGGSWGGEAERVRGGGGGEVGCCCWRASRWLLSWDRFELTSLV